MQERIKQRSIKCMLQAQEKTNRKIKQRSIKCMLQVQEKIKQTSIKCMFQAQERTKQRSIKCMLQVQEKFKSSSVAGDCFFYPTPPKKKATHPKPKTQNPKKVLKRTYGFPSASKNISHWKKLFLFPQQTDQTTWSSFFVRSIFQLLFDQDELFPKLFSCCHGTTTRNAQAVGLRVQRLGRSLRPPAAGAAARLPQALCGAPSADGDLRCGRWSHGPGDLVARPNRRLQKSTCFWGKTPIFLGRSIGTSDGTVPSMFESLQIGGMSGSPKLPIFLSRSMSVEMMITCGSLDFYSCSESCSPGFKRWFVWFPTIC